MSKFFIIFLILAFILAGICASSDDCKHCGPINHKLLRENGFVMISVILTKLPPAARNCFISAINIGLKLMEKAHPPVANMPKIINLKKALHLSMITPSSPTLAFVVRHS